MNCVNGKRKVIMELDGRAIEIDSCLAPFIKLLNEGPYKTIASCCGHGRTDGFILYHDGNPGEMENYLLIYAKENCGKKGSKRYYRDFEKIAKEYVSMVC